MRRSIFLNLMSLLKKDKKISFINTLIYVIASKAKQSIRLLRSLRRSAPRDDFKNRFLLEVLIIILLSYPTADCQNLPTLLEMLALHSGQDAVYLSINDSTAVDFQSGIYIYKRLFRSAARVLRKGGGGISTAATPAVSSDDKVEINAYTISPEGDTINISSEEITYIELYGSKQRFIISYPDARAGAVLILEWSIESTEPVFSGRRFLGRSYPAVLNRTVISAPADWEFNFLIQPTCLYHQEKSKNYIRGGEMWVNYVWAARSLPGIKFEPDSPPLSQYIPCLYYAFSHDRRWPDFKRDKIDWQLIARSYGSHLESTGKIGRMVKSEVDLQTSGISDKREKIRKLTNFITTNFKAAYSDIDISSSPGDLLNRGYGSQAEAALLLGAFLKAARIRCDFILISTRDNGEVIKTLPALFYFNRLLITAYIDSDTIWIDPFYQGAPSGVLPLEDQAVEGLKVGGNFKGFITTPVSDYRENGHAVHLKISFDDKGGLIAEGVELLSGSLNIEEKYQLQNLSTQERFERWSKLTSSGIPGSSVNELEFSDFYSDVNPFRITYKLSAQNYIQPDDLLLYIPLACRGRWKNVEKYENRQLPIELGRPHSQQERITIEIPAGFKVDYLPENFTLSSYLGEIFSVVVVTANIITITRGLSIKSFRLKASEAGSLNGFYNTAMDQATKYIVLRR